MQFMIEGGIMMWAILATALVSLGVALAKRQTIGWMAALWGAVGCLGFGIVGFSLGFINVVNYIAKTAPDEKWEILQVGVKEAVNNNLFGGALALVLVVVSVVIAPRRSGMSDQAAA